MWTMHLERRTGLMRVRRSLLISLLDARRLVCWWPRKWRMRIRWWRRHSVRLLPLWAVRRWVIRFWLSRIYWVRPTTSSLVAGWHIRFSRRRAERLATVCARWSVWRLAWISWKRRKPRAWRFICRWILPLPISLRRMPIPRIARAIRFQAVGWGWTLVRRLVGLSGMCYWTAKRFCGTVRWAFLRCLLLSVVPKRWLSRWRMLQFRVLSVW